MGMLNAMAGAALLAVSLAARSAAPAAPEFDACDVFTQADAEQALGTAATGLPSLKPLYVHAATTFGCFAFGFTGEPVNPKAKHPKVVAACTYNGFKDGKPVAAVPSACSASAWVKTSQASN